MMYQYNEQYKKGQFFTPANLAVKMLDVVPNDLWGKRVLEPTCGDGNLVIALLDKMVELGIRPDDAVSLVQANELDPEVAKECEERVKRWMVDHSCSRNTFTVTTFDASKHKFENYDWVFANPPYGTYRVNTLIMQQVVKNTCANKPAVLLVKRTFKLDNVVSIEEAAFPGIYVSTVIAATYPGKGKPMNWLDEFSDLMDESCKWECTKDEANYLAIRRTSASQLLRIKRKGESISGDALYLKLTDQEASYLLEHSANTEREQAYMEIKDRVKLRDRRILRHAVNERLKKHINFIN